MIGRPSRGPSKTAGTKRQPPFDRVGEFAKERGGQAVVLPRGRSRLFNPGHTFWYIYLAASMNHEDEPVDRVAFADVLLARRYLRELREQGSLSSDLQADVDRRGRGHIERVVKILELKEKG